MGVLIVGSGIVGSTLALALSRQKVPVHLIDAFSKTSASLPLSRLSQNQEVTLSPGSLSIFKLLGLDTHFFQKGYTVSGLKIHFSTSHMIDIALTTLGTSFSSFVTLPEKEILEGISKASGIKVASDKLESLTSSSKGVEAIFKTEKGSVKKTFDYVIGCDEGQEKIAALLSLETQKTSEKNLLRVLEVNYESPLCTQSEIHLADEKEFLGSVPLSEKKIRLIIQSASLREGRLTLETLNEFLDQRSTTSLKATKILTQKNVIGQPQTSPNLPEGPVLVCGRPDFYDISRLNFGYDLDIHQALHLGYHLGQKLSGNRLSLETYHKEQVSFQTCERQNRKIMSELIFSKIPVYFTLRKNVLPFFLRLPFLIQKLGRRFAALDVAYRVWANTKDEILHFLSRPFILGKGDMAPDVPLTTHDGKNSSLYHLLGEKQPIAFVFSDKTPVELDFSDLASKPQKTFWISSFLNSPRNDVFQDVDGQAFEKYSIKGRSVLYIVRTDGHILERRILF
tara:strand:+ start:1590 stop:3116 length:1527 start_codon:yes stop_codon:yes gene_type:complete